jgi:general secretion pathway protein N
MSMRALTLLLALSVLGNAEALAVNAPVAVDPRGAEQDLFATPTQAPVAATPAQPALAAAPAPAAVPAPTAAPAQPVLTGNPLWGIPLNRLTAVRERPLFAPSRRPAPVAAPPQPVAAAPPPPPKPAEPETPQLSLLGTVAGGREKIGLFIDSTTKSVLRLKAGENHKGWTLRAVSPHEVELARGLDTAVLAMPSPDMKASGAPSPMPAVATAPAMPVNPAAPLQARAPGVTSAIPSPASATPPGATIVLRPPVLEPPPAQVNPFQQSSPFPRMR